MIKKQRYIAALIIAIIVDIIQVPEVFTVFATAGAGELFIIVTDVLATGIITFLIGWHWALLPSFVAEVIPGVNLVPLWTVAVLIASRDRQNTLHLDPPIETTASKKIG